jgi:hypothetical protein
VEQNRSRYQEIWVFQTFLLLEFFGIHGGDDGLFLKAQRIHRDLVDALRMLQLSHDGSSSHDLLDSDDELDDTEGSAPRHIPEEAEPSDHEWHQFIDVEARKRSVFLVI